MAQSPPIDRNTVDDLMSLESERGSTPMQVRAVLRACNYISRRNRERSTLLIPAKAPPARAASTIERLPTMWFLLSLVAALLAAAGSVIGLLMPERIYGRETSILFNASIAQDLVNLFIVAPVMVILALRASRGSLRSWLCLMGFLAFTAYNYAIYAFSIHFGPLFLVWVAVLGLSVFAVAGSLASLSMSGMRASFAGIAVRLPGWFLIAVAALFTFLWLGEIVADLLAGRPSTSAASWDVPTNPVHVLDLAFFLPAVCASGVQLLRRHRMGYATAAGSLVFLGLTCLPILLTPFVAQARADVPGWSVMVPIGLIAATTLVVLWRLLHMMRLKSAAIPGES
jgi:hypothetical protein